MHNPHNDLPKCPICGRVVKEVWENNGYPPPDPTHFEMVGYVCEVHGEVEPIEDETENTEEN